MKKIQPESKDAARRKKRSSQWRLIWKRMRRNKLAMLGMVLVVVIVLSSLLAGVLSPYDYEKQDLANTFQTPSSAHWMGTDNYGRDIFTRVLYGGRISLLVSLMAIAIALIFGCLIGVTSGYFGGTVDSVMMRIMDIIMAIPSFLLAICISAALGSGIRNTAIAIAVGCIPSYARLMRAQVLGIKNQEFVEAARMNGSGHFRTMIRHIVPNTLSTIIVDSTLRIGACIMIISSLSFIGLGVQPPTPEWGSMLAAGRSYIRDFWPMVTFPGLAIMATIFGFNLFGDGLRDALDPRLKR